MPDPGNGDSGAGGSGGGGDEAGDGGGSGEAGGSGSGGDEAGGAGGVGDMIEVVEGDASFAGSHAGAIPADRVLVCGDLTPSIRARFAESGSA